MTHEEHVHLIKKAITQQGGSWADFGSGDGAFTLALRDLAGRDATIYSIDKDTYRLQTQENAFEKMFPQSHVRFMAGDFTQRLELPPLDGVIMANSLHYVEEQYKFFGVIQDYLKPNGKLILVEYNTDEENQWVPYPVPYAKFEELAKQKGFTDVQLLEKIPSKWNDEMYSAQAVVPSLFSSEFFH